MAMAQHVDDENVDTAGRRQDESQQHADCRGLAGAIAAEKCGDAAGSNREVDRIDGENPVEALAQVFNLDRGALHGATKRAGRALSSQRCGGAGTPFIVYCLPR